MIRSAATREERVFAFRYEAEAKGAPPLTKELVWKCFYEESKELDEAADVYEANPSVENRADLVKEWADVQYVLSQLALYYNIPGRVAFNRVADNNLTKVADGAIIREDGKILKPEGYVKANMRGL